MYQKPPGNCNQGLFDWLSEDIFLPPLQWSLRRIRGFLVPVERFGPDGQFDDSTSPLSINAIGEISSQNSHEAVRRATLPSVCEEIAPKLKSPVELSDNPWPDNN